MTGYANASASPVSPRAAALHEPSVAELASARATASIGIEMRSVNGRFLDFSMRLPDDWHALEPALRELATARFKRGKIELRLTRNASDAGALPTPSSEQLTQLARIERLVRSRLPDASALSVHEVLHWCKTPAEGDTGDAAAEAVAATAAAELQTAVLDGARRCMDGLAEARGREGERLAAVLRERVAHLRDLAGRAEPLVPAAVARLQQRFVERWRDALMTVENSAAASPAEAVQERALNEAAAYAIRIDVAEELARLRAHLDEVARLLERGGEVGKRLDFLIQELLREANTLGSKSSSIEMTGLSVDMKVAIEQMREQVQNLE